jgi:hypothetical protein
VVEKERRQAQRIRVDAGVSGKLKATLPIVVQNISQSGILFEVSTPVRPGALYDLKAELGGVDVAMQIRITRCKTAGHVEDGRGGRVLLFQAGAEFARIDEGQVDTFTAWIAKNEKSKRPSSATLEAPRITEE